jgi:hypothetical protein
MQRDRLGRRRQPEQGRGLRPLHPKLPARWVSRSLRLSMPEADWARLEALADRLGAGEPTRARALGRAVARLIEAAGRAEPGPLDWLDWERRKALRLLGPGN